MDGGGAVDGGGGVPGHPGGGDAVMTEAQPESQNSMMPMSATATTTENISATLSHGGRFIQYNIFGNIFEVTAKYKPPILPIGKGAYGIVWSLSLSLFLWLISSVSFFVFLNRRTFGSARPWIRRRMSTWRWRRLRMRSITRSMRRGLYVRSSCFVIWIMKM